MQCLLVIGVAEEAKSQIHEIPFFTCRHYLRSQWMIFAVDDLEDATSGDMPTVSRLQPSCGERLIDGSEQSPLTQEPPLAPSKSV